MKVRLDTPSGALEGEERGGLRAFRGIPYAAPPAGPLRLRPPERVKPWHGVRPAVRFGASAPQAGPVGALVRRLIGVGDAGQDEDCLSLNVWAPASPGPPRPVLVWIHGGAFVMGSGATRLYAGARLAARGDVVVVTVNYRLGALGFLNLRELAPGASPPPANVGLLDQIAALEWVRDHVEAFGGDPERVTLFGESAGAMSIGTLLGTPRARGLFHAAVLQSGAAHNVSSPERAADVADHFLRELEIPRPDPGLLERVPVGRILEAQTATAAALGMVDGRLPWQPSLDGELLPRRPVDAVAAGAASDIPLLVGTNQDEWRLFVFGDRRGPRMDETALRRRLFRTLALDAPEEGPRRALAERAYETYRMAGGVRSGASAFERWIAFQSDRIFFAPAARLAELQAAFAPTYAYLFDWSPPLLGRRLGACHGLEIPFVFGTLRDPWLRPLLGSTRTARRLSHRMQEAWLHFARTGHPGHAGLPHWPSYTRERRPVMVLGRDCHLWEAPFERERSFWDALL